jgi:nucleoid DNA-binding protein
LFVDAGHHYAKNRSIEMTKADLVEKVAEVTGLTKKEISNVVDAFLVAVSDAMGNGNNIEIRGFGSFKVKTRKGRAARNPRTGEAVSVPEKKVPVFKPSIELKKRCL